MNNGALRPPEETLSTDAVFEVLSHPLRRELLADLQTYDQPQAVADVAKEIAVCEHEVPFDALPSEDIERIHCSLYHVHIPKLEEVGVITHNSDRNTITLTERADRLLPHIDR